MIRGNVRRLGNHKLLAILEVHKENQRLMIDNSISNFYGSAIHLHGIPAIPAKYGRKIKSSHLAYKFTRLR